MASRASSSRAAPRASSSRASVDLSATSPDLGGADASFSESGSAAPSRSRRPASRATPVTSYAYGAPPDAEALRRARENRSLDNVRAAGGEAEQPEEPLLPQDRYARLKQRSTQGHDASVAASPARRSSRRSVAGSDVTSQAGGAAAGGGVGAGGRQHIDAIEEDEGVDSHDEAEERRAAARHAAALNAAAAKPPAPRSQASSAASFSRGTNGGNGQGKATYSFFVRPERERSASLALDDAASAGGSRVLGSTLLRGAQRPSHDPLSPPPRHADASANMSSMRSSDGESRADFTEEAAHAARLQQQQSTPRGRGRLSGMAFGFMDRVSSWGSPRGNGDEQSRDTNGHTTEEPQQSMDDSVATRRKPAPRKARNSKDNAPFRPTDDESSEEDDSDEGKQPGRRKRHSDGSSASTSAIRAGRKDNEIWSTTGKRKASGAKKAKKSGAGGAGGASAEVGDSTLEALQEEEEEGGQGEVERAEARRGIKRQRQEDGSWLAMLPTLPSVPTALRTWGVPLLVAGLAATAAYHAGTLSSSSSSSSLHASSPTFSAPNLPPSSVEGLVSRLTNLEGAVSRLSAATESVRAQSDEETRARLSLGLRVAQLERGIKEGAYGLSALQRSVEEEKMASQRRLAALETTGERARTEMARLREELQLIESRARNNAAALEKQQSALDDKTSSAESKRLYAQLAALETRAKRAEEQLAALSAQSARAQDVADAARKTLETLQHDLPAQLPVRMDRRGELHIEASFWEALGKVFASKSSSGASSSSGDGDATTTPGSWRHFLAANEASLRALAREEVQGGMEKRLGTGVVLERSDFIQLLNSEVEALQTRLETRFHENAEGLSREILGKVRQQREMFEASGSWAPSRRHEAAHPPSGGGTAPWMKQVPKLEMKLKDGSDARDSILTLIDAALEAYSADRVAQADFALFSAGARVIPSLTSPTYERASGRSGLLHSLPLLRGSGKGSTLPSRPPVVALHPDSAAGMCWPFAGEDGQLGIRLARAVVPTDISLEHVPRALAFEDARSAPRDVAVWALVERAQDRQRLAEYRRAEAAARAAASSSQASSDDDDDDTPLPAPPSPHHLLVASFAYDIARTSRAVQTFAVSAEARALRLPIATAQFRFLSNHGHAEFTCVYRVRVHGVEWKEEEESQV